jgi:hypothetical protein
MGNTTRKLACGGKIASHNNIKVAKKKNPHKTEYEEQEDTGYLDDPLVYTWEMDAYVNSLYEEGLDALAVMQLKNRFLQDPPTVRKMYYDAFMKIREQLPANYQPKAVPRSILSQLV